MKVIFESETELGRCDADRIDGPFSCHPGEWVALAHTTATMTGSKRMLRIEQHCYLRSERRLDDVRSQSCVKPEVTLEPVAGSDRKSIEMARALHWQFVQRALDEFMEASVVVVPSLAA
jgi:hypothetical protein